MEKEEFAKIMKEYGHSDKVIEHAWECRPDDKPDEKTVRALASAIRQVAYFFGVN